MLREPAAAAVLRRERWQLHCFGCWERLPTDRPKLRCSRCRIAHFCNSSCQAAEWVNGHRAECGSLPALDRASAAVELESGYGSLAEDALLLGRLTRGRPRADASARDALDALCPSPASWEGQARLIARTAVDAGLLGADASLALATRTAHTFAANNFGAVALIGSGVLGAASFPLSAILNHSCAPSCALAHVYERRRGGGGGALVWQEIRTLAPLPGGAELTHAYVDTTLGARQRRQLLRAGWGFECGCERCAAADARDAAEVALEGPAAPGGAVARALADASAAHASAIACDDPGEERALLRRALSIRQRHLAPSHAHVLELHAALLACELAQGDGDAARAHADALVRGARDAFGGRPCASFAVLLLTAAEVWASGADAGARARARAHAAEARDMLLVTHGPSHPLTRHAKDVATSGAELGAHAG